MWGCAEIGWCENVTKCWLLIAMFYYSFVNVSHRLWKYSPTVCIHLMRKCWMEAKVTHESSCSIHFLSRNRPFCGTGNVFVFPALPYTVQSLSCTASIYQCHIFLCWKRGVFHEHSILFFFFSVKTMRLEQRGAVPRKICCSLSSSVSLALSYSRCHSSSLSSPSLATCTGGRLRKISGEPIWVLSYIRPSSVTAWLKEACSFPWTLPLQSGCVELGSPLIDNVSIDGVATTVGFLCSEGFCQSTLHMSPVK